AAGRAARARAQPDLEHAGGADLPGRAGDRGDRLDLPAARLRLAAIYADLRTGRGLIAGLDPGIDAARPDDRRGRAMAAGPSRRGGADRTAGLGGAGAAPQGRPL